MVLPGRTSSWAILLLVALWWPATVPAAPAKEPDVKVEPLPDPPTVEEQVRKADLIVRAKLLHTRTYRAGKRVRYDARFRVVDLLRPSDFFPLGIGDEFSVMYNIKPDVYGPHFMEAPDPDEYVVILQLKNVTLGGRVVGQIVEFVYPNPFALFEPSDEVLQAARSAR